MKTLLELIHPDEAKVPIRSLGPSHRRRMVEHLLQLDAHDRYLRFGYAASDEQVAAYVGGIDFDRDEVFGIYNRELQLLAWAHLAQPRLHGDTVRAAEFGVSVLAKARGRGYGAMLFERAVMHARNQGLDLLQVHALSENAAMLHIARSAGASLERFGSETEAYLRLPPATLDSRFTELIDEQFGQTDYQLKRQARRIRAVIEGVQDIRETVREFGAKSGS